MSQAPAITPRWLSLGQAQIYAGLGRNTLRALADSGDLRCGWTGGGPGRGHRRWDRESIDDYMLRGEVRAVALAREMRV